MDSLPSNGQEPPPSPPRRQRILLVDDEPLILLILSGFLQDGPFECVEAANSDSALAAFSSSQFDLVITDRTMPGMNGVELTKILKSKCPKAAVLLISGMRPPDLMPPSEGGPDAFLFKPFTRESLLNCVSQLLQSPSR